MHHKSAISPFTLSLEDVVVGVIWGSESILIKEWPVDPRGRWLDRTLSASPSFICLVFIRFVCLHGLCRCLLSDVQLQWNDFYTCNLLLVACAAICHQLDYTRAFIALFRECDWCDTRFASKGFPGNIWIDVSRFIVLLKHRQTRGRPFHVLWAR